jgi:hypothetical protein
MSFGFILMVKNKMLRKDTEVTEWLPISLKHKLFF